MRQKYIYIYFLKLGLTVSMKMNHKYAFSRYVKKCHETVKKKLLKNLGKTWKMSFVLQKFMGISLNCKILCVVKRRGKKYPEKSNTKIFKTVFLSWRVFFFFFDRVCN